MVKKLNRKIIVLAGGISDEREVSLRSGEAVTKALLACGHDAQLEDMTSHNVRHDMFPDSCIAFPVLHGKGGEDGTLQAQLDSLGVPYVGSGAQASELCFDKWEYRKFLQSHDLPVAKGELVNQESFWESHLKDAPFVLKPMDGGSSIDIYILRDTNELDEQKIQTMFNKYDVLLIEELIIGSEVTVAILGDEALPVVEIIPPYGGEFDYENKYNGATQELCPPKNVSAKAQAAAQVLALQIHKLTGCADYSRTDMIIRKDESIIVLETNTLPGMTDQSLVPTAARAAGIDMPTLTDRLVTLAITRQIVDA